MGDIVDPAGAGGLMECMGEEFLGADGPATMLMRHLCNQTVVYKLSDYGMIVEVWDNEMGE